MADNTILNTASGGDTIRDKDRGSAKTQVVGLDLAVGGGTEQLCGATVGPTNITATSAFGAIALGSFAATSPAANSSLAASVLGCGVVSFGFNNTSFIGTLGFDATVDGTNWIGISVRPQGTDVDVQTIALTSGLHFVAVVECAAFAQVRLRCTAFTSGTGAATIIPGAFTSLSSLSTTGASSIGSINRVGMGHTATRTSVAALTTTAVLLAANVNRIGASCFNDSTATLYLALGSAGSNTDYTVQIPANGYYELPFGFDGAVNGLWSNAVGNVRVTEYT